MSKPYYESPLEGRYAGDQMRRIFSPDHRYGTYGWHWPGENTLWVCL